MAYAALVSLAQTIDLILNYHQDSISFQLKNQIISIHEYVIFFRAFLDDFPNEDNSLEARIRELTLSAEDIIEFSLSRQTHESRNASLESTVGPSKSKFKHQLRQMWKQIQSCYSTPKPTVGSPKSKLSHQKSEEYEHLHYYFHELKEVTNEIESIAEEVTEIKSSIIVKDVQLGDSTTASSSPSVAAIHKDAVVGFDNDLMEIKCRLCGESSKLEVIPVVGMGGIGKTTLARNVYDDPLILERFQICVWVTVSQNYTVRDIVSGLLASMKVSETKNESMEAHRVYQNLKGRRYLIVLDDIWSIKAWDDLKMMFPDDDNGSRILLTTRLLDVASYANSSSPLHELRLMDKDQSWNLLRQRVFKHDPCPIELEWVGKMIVGSCKGLPLAIVVISGLLAVDQTQAAWRNFAENVKLAISANEEQFEKILSLSYAHLPHHLRPCFLYMGGFPEDYEIRVSKLIRLWVAEGFLKPNGCKSFEEIAEEYLEDLVKRSLVSVNKRKYNGRIKSFSMHDLMRDMCIRKAQQENFLLHVRVSLPEGTTIPRRISFSRSDVDVLAHVCESTVRTIMIFSLRCMPWFLQHFRFVRILDLSDIYDLSKNRRSYSIFPAEVYKLIHLRYLAFDYCICVRIQAAISELQNLQTLVIYTKKNPRDFVQLPVEIWSMPQLRHLIVWYCDLPAPFDGGGALALQTLSGARNLICAPKTLKMIPNLKKMALHYTSSKKTYTDDYQLHNLIHLQQLENLEIEIRSNFPYQGKVNPAFPRTLKKLTLSHLGLPWKDLKIVGSLPNLEVLKLRDQACFGDTWETTEGEFSQLKFLLIDQSKLRHWITESSHFPRLKCLQLRGCWYLREIPYGIGEIPTLESIEVDYMDKDLVNCAKQIQDDQQSCGNDALQIRLLYQGRFMAYSNFSKDGRRTN